VKEQAEAKAAGDKELTKKISNNIAAQ